MDDYSDWKPRVLPPFLVIVKQSSIIAIKFQMSWLINVSLSGFASIWIWLCEISDESLSRKYGRVGGKCDNSLKYADD